MKLLFKQYLASLRERGELDAVLPDLLSELGYTIISKPSIGTRQYGVDVAAVGAEEDGARRVFLFSVKAGDLTRTEWNVGTQALRPSLDEIRDYYIPNRIPKRYRSLPIAICLCFGGDMDETVSGLVESYMTQNTTASTEYRIWNGDRLAELLLTGILRENAFPKDARSMLRKAVAMVDEPDVATRHFRAFINKACERPSKPKDRLTATRQITLALWTLFVWARDSDNLEAPYRASELALLRAWGLISPVLEGKSAVAKACREAIDKLIALHRTIASYYVTGRILPNASVVHGLTSAVPSQSAVDKNLRLFDILGRLSVHGLWLHHARLLEQSRTGQVSAATNEAISITVTALIDMINNNPILHSPLKDEHAIDINLACLFLLACGHSDMIRRWIAQIAGSTCFTFRTHGSYPCTHRDYRDLVGHPTPTDEYRKDCTAASILIPILATWLSLTRDSETLGYLSQFCADDFAHSTLQLWFPGKDTEERLFAGEKPHGLAVASIRIDADGGKLLELLRKECAATDHFKDLSPLRWSLWPILMVASRCHRIPTPPQFWPLGTAEEVSSPSPDSASA
ncbi:MAG: chemotaxis protein [Hyphomonadaceae bacterium]